MRKYKISFSKWLLNIINTIIMWLLIPFIGHEIMIKSFQMNIISDTFFAVFIVLFAIKFQYVLINAPVILKTELEPEEKEAD